MSKYQAKSFLLDTRNNKPVFIDEVKETSKGTLYTVRYVNTDDYKRYYEDKLLTIFVEYNVEQPKIDYSNVVFVDFRSKTKFANYESWLDWVKAG